MDILQASVQYGDMRGEVAIDEGDFEKLSDFARAKGVPDDYSPIGIDYYHGRDEFELLSVVAVDKKIASSFDECEKYAAAHDGSLPAVWFEVDATFEELLKYFKRFSLVFQRRFKVDRIEKAGSTDLTEDVEE